jgi:hypothetical protein
MVAERGIDGEGTGGPNDPLVENKIPTRTSRLPGRSRLGPLLRDDARRAIGAAAVGCGVLAIVEFVATVVSASRVDVGSGIRLLFLDLTLFGLLIVPMACLAIGVAVIARLAVASSSTRRAKLWPGLFSAAAAERPKPSRVAIWLWAVSLGVVVFVPASAIATFVFTTRFKAPQITALVVAVVHVGLSVVAIGISVGFAALIRRIARRLHSGPGRHSPFNSGPVAAVTLAACALIGIKLAVVRMPELGPLIPYRYLLALVALLSGVWAHSQILGRRGSLLPSKPRRRLILDNKYRKRD